ncbi:MAG: xyloglucanase [Dactylosporangium sp.]|nr:cellulose binding domain-containing protein [Dactylosporangium sp.]NNJ60882.1 xyloglucanase [Dactylosporangium sp.]
MRRKLAGGIALAIAAAGSALAIVNAVTATAATTATADTYTWENVRIDGGGFVPGLIFSRKEQNLIYARTDIGGAYRWNAGNSTWTPLLDWVGWDEWGWNGVVSIAPDPVDADKVYAAVGMYTNDWDPNNGAILRSTDRGATWQATELPFKLGGNMPGRGMGERLAVDPNDNSIVYFAAPSGNGLWKSTDSGVTWAQVTNFPNVGNYVQDAANAYTADNQGDVWVTFDPASGSAGSATPGIYVGVADLDNTVYRSTDGGASWSAISGAPTGYLAHKGVIDEDNRILYISTSDTGGPYDGAKGDVWKYDIATGTWTQISPIPSSSDDDYFGYSGLTVDRQNPGTLMVATQISWWPDAIFFRSTDFGATWTQIWDWESYPNRTFRYTMDVSDSPWLTWGSTPELPEVSPKLGWMNESLEIDPFDSDRMMYGTGATIYGTTELTNWDNDTQFTIRPMAQGLEETAVLDLMSPPSGANLVSALGDIGGFRHDSFSTVPMMFTSPNFTSTTSVDFAELNPSVMVRAGNFTDSDRPDDSHAAFSTDGGSTWFQGTEPGGVNNGGTIAAAADGSRFVWAPGDSGIQVAYSVGFGNSWSTASGIPANARIESDRVNPMTFYGLSDGTFYVSTDGGATFTTAASGLPTDAKFKAVPGHEGDIWLAGDTGVYRSTDAGATFDQISGVSGAVNIGYGMAATGADYHALYLMGTIDGVTGVYRSDDTAATWVRINDDQHQYGNAGEALTGDPRVYGRVYLGTNGRGIIYADTTGSTTVSPGASTASPSASTASPSASSTSPSASSSASPSASGTATGACTAAYSTVGSWPGGFQGEVTVTNTSGTTKSGWTVTMTFASGLTVTQLWNGTLSGSNPYTVTPTSWNSTLPASGTATFGFLGGGTIGTSAPSITCQ